MLTIEECNEYIKNLNLTEEQIENLYKSIYVLAQGVIDDYLN